MTFSDIIQRRIDRPRPQYPLWELKVRDDEYEQLKKELCDTYNRTASFDTVQAEAMLYMAEWYRREYDCDGPSKEAVFQSLQSESRDYISGGEALYKAALKNAKRIYDIQFVEGEKNMAWFYSLLYQGGLPLKKIVNNSNVWRNTIRKMVWHGWDFSDTDLPLTAAHSNSIRSFCDRVVKAALSRQYNLMPFYCHDESDEVYLFLTKETEEGIRNRKARIPFDIQWKFNIDAPAHRIEVKYALDAPQRLQEDFIQQHQLNGSVSFRIRIDDKILPEGPEYRNSRSFSPFHCERLYNEGEEITVLAGANEKVICTDSLDFSEPHVIHKEQGEDFYRLGKGHSDVRILFAEEWKCITNQEVRSYHLGNNSIQVVLMGNEDVVLQNNNGETKRFSTSTPLYWTEFENAASQDQYVQTSLFQIDKMRFYRCEDEIGRQRINNSNVSFWNYNTNTWDNNPLIGKIKARVPDGNGGFATSKMFLNTGTPIKMQIISCTETKCTVRFDWASGKIICQQGRRQNNDDDWTFEKEQLPSEEIDCVCTPSGASKRPFSIKVHVPFRGFYIYDSEGHRVLSSSLIPYSDFNVYRYSLNDEDVVVSIDGTSLPSIRIQNNSNGYLKDVLEREFGISIRMLLDKNAQSVDWAKVKLSVVRSGRTQEKYVIKEYPYHFKRINDSILVRENNEYNGDIWIIPFDRNQQYIVLHNEDGLYTLPENLQKLGKVLLISPQQRVFPKIEDLSEATSLSLEQRVRIKDETRNKISEELKTAKIDSDIWQRCLYWYNIWYNNDESVVFPWNNVFEYKYIAKDSNALLQLVLILWLNCINDVERENLSNNLLDHERDLALQWFWLPPFNFQNVESFFDVDDQITQTKLLKWAMSKGVLQNIDNIIQSLVAALNDFSAFWDNLRRQSLLKGGWMDKDCFVKWLEENHFDSSSKSKKQNSFYDSFVSIIDQLLADNIRNNPTIEIKSFEGDALMLHIVNDEDIPQTRECQEEVLPSFTNYSLNAKKFSRRVQLLINHKSNYVDLTKCTFPLRSTILYYSAKYPQAFVYLWFRHRNRPILMESEQLSILYGEEELSNEE